MTVGRIFRGEDVDQDLSLTCDVCVIGSGAGGAMLAAELTRAGLDVVMLEEGSHRTRRDFDLKEETAYPGMYQDLGNRTTDDRSVSILQGRTVGGGTTVNWCSSFRTPSRVLAHWRDHAGLSDFTDEKLAPHFDFIEERLHVEAWPLERANRNNRLLWDGLGALGYSRGLIRRNVHRCANLGYCGMGCPIDAKRSALVTLIPDAVEQGLRLYADARVEQLEHEGAKVRRVHARVLDPETGRPKGPRITVTPKHVALCTGALNGPMLLLQSGLGGGGRVGRKTFLHPVIVSVAFFEEPVEPFSGAPQSVYSHHFVERDAGKRMGFFLEVPPIHPMLAGLAVSARGERGQGMLAKLPGMQAIIALTVDGFDPSEEGGTVSVRRDGRMSFDYAFTERNWEAFRTAQREMAKLQFAAGAQQVVSLHSPPVVLSKGDALDPLDGASWERLGVRILTAHQMGGCGMGSDAKTSVVDPTFRYRGLDNLFVADGSLMPTSLGVNPMETILALGRMAAPHVKNAVA